MIFLNFIIKHAPIILLASINSIIIAFGSFFLGFILSILISSAQYFNNFFINKFIKIYLLIIQGTPMMAQIVFWYYFLPSIGIQISSIFIAIIAIGINSGAYLSQVIQSGILAIDKEQIDSAKVFGFNNMQIIRYIIFPQAINIIFPSLINEVITLMKDSSLASTIGVIEIYKESRSIINQTYDVLSTFILLSIIYIIFTFLILKIGNILHRKFNYYD